MGISYTLRSRMANAKGERMKKEESRFKAQGSRYDVCCLYLAPCTVYLDSAIDESRIMMGDPEDDDEEEEKKKQQDDDEDDEGNDGEEEEVPWQVHAARGRERRDTIRRDTVKRDAVRRDAIRRGFHHPGALHPGPRLAASSRVCDGAEHAPRIPAAPSVRRGVVRVESRLTNHDSRCS
jgi:hypothetical protein